MDQKIVVNRTFSVTLFHVAQLSDMALRMGKSYSEVLRQAIEEKYERMQQAEDTKAVQAER